jgi:2-(3-amino-3-carboxypropyl)histidine synthase
MQKKTVEEINKIYGLEVDRIIKEINGKKVKKVLLQFPEGMKPYATIISREIENKTKTQCFIWLDSCFGACDIPVGVEKLGIDLIIQFGHSKWDYS